MKLSGRVKRINSFKDNAACEESRNTIALLKILAMGRKQIEEGKFRRVRKVFAEMNAKFLQ